MQLTNLIINNDKKNSMSINDSFEKAHVKSYTKTTKSGKMVQVKEHEDKRKKRQELLEKIKNLSEKIKTIPNGAKKTEFQRKLNNLWKKSGVKEKKGKDNFDYGVGSEGKVSNEYSGKWLRNKDDIKKKKEWDGETAPKE